MSQLTRHAVLRLRFLLIGAALFIGPALFIGTVLIGTVPSLALAQTREATLHSTDPHVQGAEALARHAGELARQHRDARRRAPAEPRRGLQRDRDHDARSVLNVLSRVSEPPLARAHAQRGLELLLRAPDLGGIKRQARELRRSAHAHHLSALDQLADSTRSRDVRDIVAGILARKPLTTALGNAVSDERTTRDLGTSALVELFDNGSLVEGALMHSSTTHEDATFFGEALAEHLTLEPESPVAGAIRRWGTAARTAGSLRPIARAMLSTIAHRRASHARIDGSIETGARARMEADAIFDILREPALGNSSSALFAYSRRTPENDAADTGPATSVSNSRPAARTSDRAPSDRGSRAARARR